MGMTEKRLIHRAALALVPLMLAGCAALGPSAATDAALREKVEALEKRLALIESRQDQRTLAFSKAREAVAYVWGAYTFVDSEGRPLRHVLNEKGHPVADAKGVPLVDVTGKGEIAYTPYCGTAFIVGRQGELLTNRHVAQPWWRDKKDEPLLQAGMKPAFLILRAFFQETVEGVPIEIVAYDENLDIALAKTVDWIPKAEPLALHPEAEAIREAQPVFLIGYPTGLEAILAKLVEAEKRELDEEEHCSYETAKRLSAKGRLKPTSTSGFLWEVYPHLLVYDARTIGGGSGGPLMDMNGRVLGVNAEYLEQFEGGNYGVPISFGRALLDGRGVLARGATRESPDLQGAACGEETFFSEAAGVCERGNSAAQK